ncbi:MAG: hypothetical protein ACPGVY_17205 [Mycobacterium sp.]
MTDDVTKLVARAKDSRHVPACFFPGCLKCAADRLAHIVDLLWSRRGCLSPEDCATVGKFRCTPCRARAIAREGDEHHPECPPEKVQGDDVRCHPGCEKKDAPWPATDDSGGSER